MVDEKNSSDILKIDDAARYLGVTRRWVYRRIWSGDLPASKVGGFYFLRKDDLESLLTQNRLGDTEADPVTAKTSLLKCGYCFRILETDTAISDVCHAEGCEELICNQCAAEGIYHCTQHVPDREELWQQAVQKQRAGELSTLLKGSMARVLEVNFLQRVQTHLNNIHTIRHPLSDDLLNIPNWDAILEERDERSEIMKMTNKVILDADWLARTPLNASLYYQIIASPKQKFTSVAISVQVLSHTKSMLQQGYDTLAFSNEELSPILLHLGEQAQKKKVFSLVMLAATTGWDESARRLIRGEGSGSAFAHRWLMVYLNDLHQREIIYNHLDARARPYVELFTSLLPDEEEEEIMQTIEKEMGAFRSFALKQAQEILPYSAKSIENAFTKLAASGRYVLITVPEYGQVLSRS